MTLLSKLSALTGPDNHVDVLCEIALFEPTKEWPRIRANNAGTKVIYSHSNGTEETCWADDWTTNSRREQTIAALKAKGIDNV